MHAGHPWILNADEVEQVWGRFYSFLQKFIGLKERGVLVAWNGGACDLEWIYRLTKAPGSKLSFPKRIKYFLDPYRAIKKTKGCRLNEKYSGLNSYSLGSVYEKIVGLPLENAHCSLVDAMAQMTVVLSSEFRRIFNTKNNVRYISEMFTNKEKKRMQAIYEPKRAVHEAWSSDNKAEAWKPSRDHVFLGGSQGGSDARPSPKLVRMASRGCSIVDLFFEYVTINDIWEPMAKFTQHYACEEFVATSVNGRKKSKPKLKKCRADHPNARYRLIFDQNRRWRFTPGLMIAWHGILIYHGGKAGEKDSPVQYWQPMHRGTYAPFIQNLMPKHVFEACRRFIHLSDSSLPKAKKGTKNYDPIYKCRKLMKKVMDEMVCNWIAGERVCVDESMI